uniref:Uncharacterized protein n=1 Tax=Anguilla anguilla TaxID=7936 RepID=A0A0E9RDL4_ANGAN
MWRLASSPHRKKVNRTNPRLTHYFTVFVSVDFYMFLPSVHSFALQASSCT